MTRLVSGAFDLALKVALVMVACAGCAPSSAQMTGADRHVVANRLAHVALEKFEVVSFLDADLYTAVQTREAVESEFKMAYGQPGHPRWFFHAFDTKNLDFIVARFEPTEAKQPRYVAERRIRVKRSKDAERALGVIDVVREYELGIRGVKVGMSGPEVVRIAGRPVSGRQAGSDGNYELVYPSVCLRFVNYKVAQVVRRDQCPK